MMRPCSWLGWLKHQATAWRACCSSSTKQAHGVRHRQARQAPRRRLPLWIQIHTRMSEGDTSIACPCTFRRHDAWKISGDLSINGMCQPFLLSHVLWENSKNSEGSIGRAIYSSLCILKQLCACAAGAHQKSGTPSLQTGRSARI